MLQLIFNLFGFHSQKGIKKGLNNTESINSIIKEGEIMDWLYGFGALLFGSGSLYFFFQQIFLYSLIAFILAIALAYLFENSN